MSFEVRTAVEADFPALRALMALAIDTLQVGFLSPEQILASRAIMGLDTQLVKDGTYFIVEEDGALAGCGGWSRRATLYGGDHSASLRDPVALDPSHDPARVRAMYTHPLFVRRGVGRLILAACEDAAAAEGFSKLELMATLSGVPLYTTCGYEVLEAVEADVEGTKVPLLRMGKTISGKTIVR